MKIYNNVRIFEYNRKNILSFDEKMEEIKDDIDKIQEKMSLNSNEIDIILKKEYKIREQRMSIFEDVNIEEDNTSTEQMEEIIDDVIAQKLYLIYKLKQHIRDIEETI